MHRLRLDWTATNSYELERMKIKLFLQSHACQSVPIGSIPAPRTTLDGSEDSRAHTCIQISEKPPSHMTVRIKDPHQDFV